MPEQQPPEKIKPKGLGDYLEVITKAVFQSGMSWKVVEAKWDGFREAFDGFEPVSVASLEPPDVDRLVEDTRIIRNRRKIEATIYFDALVDDLRDRLKFLGDMGAIYTLYVVGEKTPDHKEWMASRKKR